jgi:branched-chain amino acid transport system substrate-binding protein
MGRRFFIGIVAVVALLGFLLYFPIESRAAQKAKKQVKIGVVIPTTGIASGLTPGVLAAMELAIEKIEKEGGWLGAGAKMIVRDSKLNPEVGARMARELIEMEKVDVIMGAYSSSVALAVSEVCKEKRVPFCCIGGKTDKLTEENFHPYVFRTATTATCEGRSGARMAARLLRGKVAPRVSVCSWDYEYGHSVWNAFVPEIKRLIPDVQIPYEAWTKVGETDYGPVIEALLGRKIDLVFNLIWAAGVPTFVSQAVSYGFFNNVIWVTGAEGHNAEYMRQLGKQWPEGLWGNTYSCHTIPNTPIHKEYMQLLGKKLNVWPPNGAPISMYLGVLFYGRAVQKAKTTDPVKVMQALEGLEIDAPNSPTGKLYIRAQDHQCNAGQVWGKTKYSPEFKQNILVEEIFTMGDETWKSEEEVKALQPAIYRDIKARWKK